MFRFKAIAFLIIVASMVLTACQPAATPFAEEEFSSSSEEEAPAATEPPEVVAPDESSSLPTDTPDSVSVPSDTPTEETDSVPPIATTADVLEITSENFDEEVMGSPVPVLIHFWAEWSGPSRVIKPAVEEIANEYAGRVTVGEINVDDYAELTEQFGIQQLPTFIVIYSGAEQTRIEGVTSKDEIIGMLDQQLP